MMKNTGLEKVNGIIDDTFGKEPVSSINIGVGTGNHKQKLDLLNLKDATDRKETNMLDFGNYYVVVCSGLIDNKGSDAIIVAKFLGHDDWYSGFPYDQPVKPKYFSYGLKID